MGLGEKAPQKRAGRLRWELLDKIRSILPKGQPLKRGFVTKVVGAFFMPQSGRVTPPIDSHMCYSLIISATDR